MRKEQALNLVLVTLIFVLSFVYFYKVILATDKILIHGDYRYGLTVDRHIQYHLNEIYVHAPKIPFFAVLYLFSLIFGDILAEKLFTVFILFISALSIYYANRYFLMKLFDQENDVKIPLSAFIGTLLFLYNPWTINKIHHHYWLVLSLAFSYLLLAQIDRVLIDKKLSLKKILIISGLITGIATQVQGLILYMGFVVLVYVLCFVVFERREFLKNIANKKVILTLGLTLLLNLFWILPQITTLLSGVTKPSWYAIVAENVDTLSRRATILNVMLGTNRWIWGGKGWLSTPDFSFNILNTDIWKLLSLFPFIFAVVSLLFIENISNEKRKYILYFAILLIASVLFSTGSYYPIFGDLYRKVFLDTSLGWVIRDPFKNTGLVIISLSFLISFLSYVILKSKNRLKPAFMAFMVFTILIWGWPALTGDLNGHLKPYLVNYPKDLEKTIEYLEHLNDKAYYNILWYPPKLDRNFLIYNDVPQISSSNLNIFTIEDEELAKFIEHTLRNGDKNTLLRMFDDLGIKYVILRHDLTNSKEEKRLSEDIKSFEKLFKKFERKKFGNYTLYEIPWSNRVVSTQPLLTLTSSAELNEVFLLNGTLQTIYFENFYILSKTAINTHFDKFILKVKSKHYNPEKYWSLGSYYGGWLKRFVPYLKKFNIENWQSDYGYGLVFTWAKRTNLTIPFKVEKTDNYKLFIRYFKNQKGGKIVVYLDGKPIVIETKDQLNKFVWKDLGTFHLKAGEHKIVLENVEGFNAVNLFVLIPEKEYHKALNEVKKILKNKTVIYLFEAESDLYRSNANVIKNINASNGEELLFYPKGKAWQEVEILKPGTYRLALKGYGTFKVTLGNNTFLITSKEDFAYTPPFHLEEGKYRLEVVPRVKNSKLDVIWLYSSNKTIPKLFEVKEKPAKVISYEKINPTLWKVKVNATKPFMLSFAEAYDPLWEARVYKDGKLVEKVKSIPLYSVINGFWINETGNLTIIIRYTPQDWFELGLKISATTFIFCIAYLFYDWRREKGDGWTKKIETKVKDLLRTLRQR